MENIFTDAYGTFENRTKSVDAIIAEHRALFIPAENPRDEFDGTYRPHDIAVTVFANVNDNPAEFELFLYHSEFDQIEILNNLIIDAEITDTAHLTRIIKFIDSDFAYIHHLIGHGFHQILNQI